MARSKNNLSARYSPDDAATQFDRILSGFFAHGLNSHSGRLRLCVALSGGRDSVVLLHSLRRMLKSSESQMSLSALHVHHGISANADCWAEFCAQFCQRHAIPLQIVHVDVPRNSGEGLEAAARHQRHAAFTKVEADWLVLAHHRDDQAETALLNLLRGAGIAGTAGMLAFRPQASGPILARPLLAVPRALIEVYAKEQGLSWIDDESNEDLHYRRNFLRRDVLPRLEEKFPGAKKSLARAASHFAEGAELLDELARIDFAALSVLSGRIALHGFNALPPSRARNLLRYVWVEAGFRAPDTRWMNEAIKQLATTCAASETCLATPDGELHVYRGELHLVGHRPVAFEEPVCWSGEKALAWAGGRVRFVSRMGGGISRRLLDECEFSLMGRQGGEKLKLHARRPRRSLRNLLQEAAIPPWERVRLPYLWSKGKLVWVGGLGVDQSFACAPDEEGILPIWEA